MESVSRISSLLETARDLTLEAARDASTSIPRKTPTAPLPPAQIKKLLDSKHEREVLDGLRRVISLQYANPPTQPTLPFFPAVLKTLSTPYPSTRPLVYTYLLHHADKDPDTALLAINTIQKSLSDPNPRVRAMALKTMSGIRVPVISQIVTLAIKKGVSDLSPLVRKAAAYACVKCIRLDPATRPQMEDFIATLLADKQYYVVGAAVQAFMEVCPEREEMVHPVFRALCRMVVDMDEWAQLAVVRLCTGYARRNFPQRTRRVRKGVVKTREERARDFYEDLEPKTQDAEVKEDDDEYEDQPILDPDLELYLTSTTPLLQSHNAAVILAVTRSYLYLSPTTHLPLAIPGLIALLRSPPSITQIALPNILQILLLYPTLFTPYTSHFLLHASDPPQTQTAKLEALTLLFPHLPQESTDLILAELSHFSTAPSPTNPSLVREAVRAIGRCAASSPPSTPTSRRCLALLLKQIRSPDANLVGEAMEVIRYLIQRAPEEHRGTVVRLARNLDVLGSGAARAGVVWLVGEFAGAEQGDGEGEGIAADVLRILLRGYADEGDEVRAQIVLLAAKVYLHHLNAVNKAKSTSTEDTTDTPPATADTPSPDTHPIERLYTHTMLLAHYTPSYDLRDRARTYRALLSNPANTDLASLLLLAPKPIPLAPSPSEARKNFPLGSVSLIVGEGVGDGDVVPDWVQEGEEPDPRLRDDGAGARAEVGAGRGKVKAAGDMLDEALVSEGSGGRSVAGGVVVGKGRKEKTLDDWLDEEGSGSEESSSSGEEEESEEETEEEESEYETESEEEDEKAGLVK